MRIYCKSNDAHGQTVYGAKVHATGVCSQCGMSTGASNFWDWHVARSTHTTPVPGEGVSEWVHAELLSDERRQHNSTAAQLRDARDLLNQVNHELAELGDENNRLRAEVSKLKNKQPRSLP